MSLAELLQPILHPWAKLYAQSLASSKPVVTLPAAANTTLTQVQSGTLFLIPQQTASNTVNLPAPASGNAGVVYYFQVTATADGSHTLTISSGSTTLYGYLFSQPSSTATMTLISGSTNIILSSTANNVKIGDTLSLTSDGTHWGVNAVSGSTSAAAWTVS